MEKIQNSPAFPEQDHTENQSNLNLFQSIFIVIGSVLCAHFMAFGRVFIWDDSSIIRTIRNSGTNLFAPDQFGYVRPGKTLLISIQYHLFGQSTVLYNLFSMVLALLLSVLILFLLRHFLKPVPALLGTLVYAVHPHHLESTFWLAANNGAWVAVFGVLTYLLVIDYIKTNNHTRLALAFLTTILAVFMKEDGLSVIPITALLFWFSGQKWTKERVLYLIVAAIFSVAFILYNRIQAAGFGQDVDTIRGYSDWMISLHSPWIVILHGLYFLYPFFWAYYQLYDPPQWLYWLTTFIGLLTLLSVIISLKKNHWKLSVPLLGILIFAVAMFPISNAVPLRNEWFGVRYLSHAGIGIALLIGWLIQAALSSSNPTKSRVLVGTVSLWLVTAAISSNMMHRVWSDNTVFIDTMIEKTNRVLFSYEKASNEFAAGDLEKAEARMRDVIENQQANMRNTLGTYESLLGQILVAQNRFDDALVVLLRAEKDLPENVENNLNIAFSYEALYDQSGNNEYIEKAITYYQRGLSGRVITQQNHTTAFINLGRIFAIRGELDRAIEIWSNGMELYPDSTELKTNLGIAKAQKAAMESQRTNQ